ncbi:MAG: AI-2E family transporter [Armatimonadota bacterium]|nr:AI-2E family transporter [Armatimonadota bacterium]
MISPPRRDTARSAEAWFGQFWKLLVRLAVIAFAGYFVWRVRTILTDILVASILAFALVGPVNWLCRFRIPKISLRTHRLIATLLVFFALGYLVFTSIVLMVSPFMAQVHGLASNLPLYERKIALYAAALQAQYNGLPPNVKALLRRPEGSGTGEGFSPMPWLQSLLLATVTGIARIVDLILIPVLAFYFVLDGHALRNEFLAVLPRRRVRETLALMRESSAIMRTYIIAQLWLCVIAGVVVYIGLSLIHMPYALVLGLLAGFTRAIPIIGPILGGIPIVLLAAVLPPEHGGGIALALKVLVFFSGLHLFESKLLMPKFIGHRIHLHAAVVIIVLLIGAEFFGLLGMFLAAPLAAIGRVLIAHYVLQPRRRAARRSVQTAPPLLIKTQ